MTSVGSSKEDSAENWLEVIRVAAQALGGTPEDRVALAPAHMHDELRDLLASGTTAPAPGLPTTLSPAGPRPWFHDHVSDTGYYWARLRKYLAEVKERPDDQIQTLHSESDHVLSYIEDPSPSGAASFAVHGLVLGYVQSGKTANFTALIAKAADRGYRLIIVLSGIHNSLRSQTQSRLNKELGLEDGPDSVGIPIPDKQWWGITSAEPGGDFKPTTDPAPLAQGVRGIMVIKKNATVLRRLVRWLERVPADVPTLIIDDEADQASINTGLTSEQTDITSTDVDGNGLADEIDPSTINGLVREIVNGRQRVSYVAYTATPFANVLIDPDSSTSVHGRDLYPRDFIISLSSPKSYFGTERFFGRNAYLTGEPILDVTRTVPDNEISGLAPTSATVLWEPEIQGSLAQAILQWVLASAANDTRNGKQVSSMLIHTSHSIQHQNRLKVAVASQLSFLQNQWRYAQERILADLEEQWVNDFVPTTTKYGKFRPYDFGELYPALDSLLGTTGGITVLSLNSSSEDVLDYQDEENQKLILIGGNRLSRGLTIENLLVSFYVRPSAAYDTLLQMGRWFGYRGEYVDLTRLWTTSEIYERFRHLSLVEEDFRDQIKIYETAGLTPIDLAPKIRSHPEMLVTARNRMGSGHLVKSSYSGELVQTIHFDLNNQRSLQSNLDITRTFIQLLGRPHHVAKGRPLWHDVPAGFIVPYLQRYACAKGAQSLDLREVAAYVRRQSSTGSELTDWTVVVRSSETRDTGLGSEDLSIESIKSVQLINRSRRDFGSDSIGALVTGASNGALESSDEASDLSDAELEEARRTLVRKSVSSPSAAIRLARPPRRGLLIIYPISPYSAHKIPGRELFEDPSSMPTVIGVAVSLPVSKNGSQSDYIVGKRSVTGNPEEIH